MANSVLLRAPCAAPSWPLGPGPPAPSPAPRVARALPARSGVAHPPSVVAHPPPPPPRAPPWDGGPVPPTLGIRGAPGARPAVLQRAAAPALSSRGVSGSARVGMFSLGPSAKIAAASIGRSSGRLCPPAQQPGARHRRLVLLGPSRSKFSPRLRAPMRTSSLTSINFCPMPHWRRNSRGRLRLFATSSVSVPRHPPRGRS